MPSIFISYRRCDSAPLAETLHQSLENHKISAFWDTDEIKPGDPWPDKIRFKLEQADILIVLIGPKWMEELKKRRTAKPDEQDWVYTEVLTGLARNMSVIPVLFKGDGDKKYPELCEDQLPPDLKRLAFIQYYLLENTVHYNVDGKADTCSDDVQSIEGLIHVLPHITSLSVLRTALESAYNQMTVLQIQDEGGIRELIETLRNEKVSDSSQASQQIDVEQSECELKEGLLKIIKSVGVQVRLRLDNLIGDDQPKHEYYYVCRQLENILESASARLACADRDSEKEDQIYGYERLVGLITEHKDSTKGHLVRYAGQRGLAYYQEYYKPALIRRLKTLGNVQQRVYIQQLKDTWREFIPNEVIGGALIVLFMALALGVHNVVVGNFMSPDFSAIAGKGALDNCLPLMEQTPLCQSPAWRGALIDMAFLAGAVIFGIGGVQFFTRVLNARRHTPLLMILGTAIVALAAFWVKNDPVTQQFGGIRFGEFVAGFFAVGVLTLPGSLITLAATAWSSVIVGERKIRRSPDVGLWVTLGASAVGLAVTLFFFAAVVEKSRPYTIPSAGFGLLWGIVLGVLIYLSRRNLFKPFRFKDALRAANQKSDISAGLCLKRAVFVALGSVLFTLAVGLLTRPGIADSISMWPNYDQFIAIRALTSPLSKLTGDQAAMALNRLIMLGAWVGFALFFGMEIMNDKMMDTGQTPQDVPESASNVPDAASKTDNTTDESGDRTPKPSPSA